MVNAKETLDVLSFPHAGSQDVRKGDSSLHCHLRRYETDPEASSFVHKVEVVSIPHSDESQFSSSNKSRNSLASSTALLRFRPRLPLPANPSPAT